MQLAGATGQVLWKYDYDAFGVERPIAGQDPEMDKNTWRYCDEYYDTETGTVYLRARNYEARTGRFTQQDGWEFAKSNDPLSLNLYTYCENNPVMYGDPSGNMLLIDIPLVEENLTLHPTFEVHGFLTALSGLPMRRARLLSKLATLKIPLL